METSQVRFTPLPSGLVSRLPCSMCQRTVRGDIPRALAACCVFAQPEGAARSRSVAALSPRDNFSVLGVSALGARSSSALVQQLRARPPGRLRFRTFVDER
jgi:hypothetical protein